LGDELLQEVVSALGRLKGFPQIGISAPHGYKRCIIRRFPYSLFYRTTSDQIVVVAFVHHRRRPLAWVTQARREDDGA